VNEYINGSNFEGVSSERLQNMGRNAARCIIELAELGKPEDEIEAKKKIVRALKKRSKQLGNTPSVCRSCYVLPLLLRSFHRV